MGHKDTANTKRCLEFLERLVFGVFHWLRYDSQTVHGQTVCTENLRVGTFSAQCEKDRIRIAEP